MPIELKVNLGLSGTSSKIYLRQVQDFRGIEAPHCVLLFYLISNYGQN